MKRWLAATLGALAIGAGPVLLATPAYAGYPTDAWPQVSGSNGPVGAVVLVRYKIHVTGDYPVPAGEMFITYTAPSGTEIPLFPDVPRQFEPPRCQFAIPKTKVRCRDVFHHFPDTETDGVAANYFHLKIVKASVGIGRITVEYPQDTKRSNDSATFTVKVDGYTPPPSPKKSSAAPRPARSSAAPLVVSASPAGPSVPVASPSTQPSVVAESAGAASVAAAPGPVPLASIQAVRTAGQARPTAMTIGLVGGGLLVSLGLGVLLWFTRRSRGRAAEVG